MSAAVLDLTREVREAPLEPIDVRGLSAEDHARAIEAWRERMVSEHASARVFAGLVPQVMRAGMPRRIVAEVSSMIDDELEHGLECARVMAALGGVPVSPLPDKLDDLPPHEDAPPLEALLRNVISVSCLHETIAVALITAEREQVAEHPVIARVFTSVLGDEVRHARLGWRLVRDASPHLDADTKEALGAYLVGAFEHLLHYYRPVALSPETSARALALGVPDGPSGWRLVLDTVESVIVPGLERHGVPARAAWSAAVRPDIRAF
jgi:hypothetical protein